MAVKSNRPHWPNKGFLRRTPKQRDRYHGQCGICHPNTSEGKALKGVSLPARDRRKLESPEDST